jgi:hypothetical protein
LLLVLLCGVVFQGVTTSTGYAQKLAYLCCWCTLEVLKEAGALLCLSADACCCCVLETRKHDLGASPPLSTGMRKRRRCGYCCIAVLCIQLPVADMLICSRLTHFQLRTAALRHSSRRACATTAADVRFREAESPTVDCNYWPTLFKLQLPFGTCLGVQMPLKTCNAAALQQATQELQPEELAYCKTLHSTQQVGAVTCMINYAVLCTYIYISSALFSLVHAHPTQRCELS